ncbi:MAG: cytochrome c oxidase subunit II [Chloroflexi bacterium]|nr:cytochrome c oxidase subunit II [Chloroflexota bacterium]
MLSNQRRFWLIILALGAIVLILLSACGEAQQTTLSPQGDNAQKIHDLFVPITWVAFIILVVVEFLLIFAVIRFRARKGQGQPKQVHGNNRLEIAWTIAPALVLVGIGIPTILTVVDLSKSAPPEAVQIKVTGHQWWWQVEYPALGVVTANEIHVPMGQVIGLTLESADVIHSFWAPELAGKMDMVPGRTNYLTFVARKPGIYFAQCAEFCGIGHANMRFRVVVEPDDDAFMRWAENLRRPPAKPDDPQTAQLAQQGAQLFTSKLCLICHTVAGTSAAGTLGPNLTNFGTRLTLGAGLVENTPENVAQWLRDPDTLKPGTIMKRDAPVYNDPTMALSEPDVQALVAYLESLKPDLSQPPAPLPTPAPTATPRPEPTTTPAPGATPSATRVATPTAPARVTPTATPAGPAGPGDPAAGQRVFSAQGCTACHTTGTAQLVGPGLGGISTRGATRVPGKSAEEYIRESIVSPNAFTVPGFPPGVMPTGYGDRMTAQGLNDLIAYLMSLR